MPMVMTYNVLNAAVVSSSLFVIVGVNKIQVPEKVFQGERACFIGLSTQRIFRGQRISLYFNDIKILESVDIDFNGYKNHSWAMA